MDKQQLLKRFQTNYLSRQDILFKLPLNISIDSFWPELLSWRKSRATMLPLHNASGQPLWYVTTDKMIRASERLCNEALDREDTFDPYRIQMTQDLSNALTMESYFTSFVEGADYTLEDAIAFLRRGTEPENQYEQNILNNYQALSYLLSALSVPIDEHYVKDLAFILTDGQNDGSVEYRKDDIAPIPAMEGEAYTVPAAFTLPNHMEQFYTYLSDNRIHPLIKAAVIQAFILTTRPFPEGNDRLARIISSAVLLRCGYDFFLDISISSFIAKENYRYFKAMKEIIRAENEGDLTYFVEYYLTMLVRALDSTQAERVEQEREVARQMALQPLAPSPPTTRPGFSYPINQQSAFHPMDQQAPFSSSIQQNGMEQNGMVQAAMEQIDIPPAVQFMTPEMMQSIRIVPPAEFPQPYNLLPQDGSPPQAISPSENGFPPENGIPRESGFLPGNEFHPAPGNDIESLIANSVSLSAFADGDARSTASFRAAQSQAGSTQADITVLEKAPEISPYTSILEEIAPIIPIENFVRKMTTALNMKLDKFDSLEWGDVNLLDNEGALIECDILFRAGILDRYMRRGRFVYLFRFDSSAELEEMVRQNRITQPIVSRSPESELFWSRLAFMESSSSDTLQRGAGFIRDMVREGIQEFSKADWIERTGMSEGEYTSCRTKMMDLGLVDNLSNPDGVNTRRPGLFRFRIAKTDLVFPETIASGFAVDTDISGAQHDAVIHRPFQPQGSIVWNDTSRPNTIQQMLNMIVSDSDSVRSERIRNYLLPRLNGNNEPFTAQDWEQYFQISRPMAEKDVRKASNLGILERNEDCPTGEMHKYRLAHEPLMPVVHKGLCDLKKSQLITLFRVYGKGPFTVEEFAQALNIKLNSVGYRLEEYVDRGYLTYGKSGQKPYYRLSFSPHDHPEYFRFQEAREVSETIMPVMA